ncbi:cullin-associated NEDD8-dissociated protein 1-like isoform X1 [Diabrotica undecimpunctata]|uniref:cullin-associated NEDD8-dissociated protein 1-like isoform X1 n=1 Tax=Diabrotica undecimpunctata TaxID=50387 RepID=UPI003B6418C1
MASVSNRISNLLEKMTSSDKDFRFMATNDLMIVLQTGNVLLDTHTEKKVILMLLSLLEDQNGEVQNLAIKCLDLLVTKVKEPQVEAIVLPLCANMIAGKEQLRDISSIVLKTVIVTLSQTQKNLSHSIVKKMAESLTSAIESDDVSIQLRVLDIITDLLVRFGPALQEFHSSIIKALLPQLRSQRQAVRKRTITVCSNLVLSCNKTIYTKLVDHLYKRLCSNKNSSQVKTYIQCASAVCRQSGPKFGEHIDKFVLLTLEYCDTEDDELLECCLQALGNFITTCPKEMTKNIHMVINVSLKYLVYDPNYIDENAPEDNCSDENEDEYSDDDDMSWKVRKSAAKCLESIIITRPELLNEFYKSLSPTLISRFKEREENVRSDIFHAYISLLKETKGESNINHNTMLIDDEEESSISLLQQQIEPLVKAVQAQLRTKSLKTRQDCFHLLKELCVVLPGALSNYIGELIPGILFSFKENSASVKLDVLSFVYRLVTTHPPHAFYPYISTFLPTVINAVNDSFYKITAQALNVLQEFVKVIRPMDAISGFDFRPYTKDIYVCTYVHLKATDVDQEVKEKAIYTMGQVICNFGDHLRAELPDCLPLFLNRLKNETTRLTTIKVLTQIASSPLGIKLPILSEVMSILATYLRKSHRILRLSTLQLIDSVMNNYHKDLNEDLLKPIVSEIPQLIDESDLQVTQKTLVVLQLITLYHPKALQNVRTTIMPQIILLVQSPLLQDSTLQSILGFLNSLIKCDSPGYSLYLRLLKEPILSTPTTLSRQVFCSLAKCVATITAANDLVTNEMILVFINEFKIATTDHEKIFALLVLGEIGRKIDLSSSDVINIILESFVSKSEEINSAASYALGSVCVGKLCHYMPLILKHCQADSANLYLFLTSLKVAIAGLSETREGKRELLSQAPLIWQQLYNCCDCTEEGKRNVAAECLGKLALLDPNEFLPILESYLNSTSPLIRSTVVTAVTFTISDQPSPIDQLLIQCIGKFLNTLKDPDINVRRVALVAFNTASHNKPSLIRNLLDSLLPQIYEQTIIKEELIREVQMGPFKHTVDDGLDIRKAAYECMYTLLDTFLEKLDIVEFINHLERALNDHYDIKMLTHHIIIRLSQICPEAVLQSINKLLGPLKSSLEVKVKANSVKQEYEKQEELKKSAEQVIAVLQSIPPAVAC